VTPDTLPNSSQGQYLSNITNLILGAEKTLYIQLQYIEASGGKGDPYDNLLKTIAGRIAAGVDVRLIVSADYAEKNGEKMKAQGVDLTANIYTQPNVHNKGFVADSKTIVVSSQNFSPSGVATNRDAGVIIEHAGIAQYFQDVLLSDFDNRSKPFVAGTRKPPPQSKAGGKKVSGKKPSAKKPGSKKPSTKKPRGKK
jgi:phosphatidylserine/phosphatidylglycerophosphate/cardiolipin synthase-like enzyme